MQRLLPLLAILPLAATAAAQPVTVDLPLLLGDYDEGFVLPNDAPTRRTCTFTMPPEVTTIDMMRMFTSGSGTEGAYISERDVGGTVVRDTLPFPCGMRLLLTSEPLAGAFLYSVANLPEEGVEDAESHFWHSEGAPYLDFNLLVNMSVEAELICWSGAPEPRHLDPLGTVTDLRLEVEGQTVPADTRAWGDIKALYR